ncbi:tRNA lysidine(34) synthetase TilS [Lentilactobacillus laojiaonis]|uniref:tRNA lysidine(34) synthetase TilS n=1 Tax=Lentilactobacillus laojiaonis TaxID=2883998 RepID=UPI001D0BBC20|nr:tRNA lysidine(34) synthetase TilS [Lentilactobacillus laojiaonis]UDM31914.1 tRNA lysidine(34) synthetase TilS [Lentilactobacillus laojiaonis]
MNLQQKFNFLVRDKKWWKADQKVVVAVSTGVDSMVLVNLLENLPHTLRPQIIVAYVDHDLRKQSKQETQFIKDYCKKHHLSLETTFWPKMDHPKHGIEEAARNFRYTFFNQVMLQYNASILLTAHHGDDLAETILMKLVRGGKLAQLIGIKEVRSFYSGKLIRPLLSFSKSSIRQYATKYKLQWYEDVTNQQLEVFRNRVRNLYLPKLKTENSRLLDHLLAYSRQIDDNESVLNELLQPVVQQVMSGQDEIDLVSLKKYSQKTQMVILEQILGQNLLVKKFKQDQIIQLVKLINNLQKPQGYVWIDQFKFEKKYDRIKIQKNVLETQNNDKIPSEFVLVLNKWFLTLNRLKIQISPVKDLKLANLWLLDSDFPLTIRKAHQDDKLALKNGHQSIERALINAKIPSDQRSNTQLLINSKKEVLAIIGVKNAYRPINVNAKPYILKIN